MSRTLSALVLAAFVALGLTSQANAAFTTPKCGGADIDANGASFANNAHTLFKEEFRNSFCGDTPFAGVNAPVLTYTGNGSGAGRTAMMTRSTTSRFAGSDEPPTPEDILRMNTGVPAPGNPAADPNPNDNGQVHVIPAAIGAIAPLVNFPSACEVTDLVGTDAVTAEEGSDDVIRVRFTREQFERIWAGDPAFDTWDEVFEGLECTGVPIIRVVRFDNSGSTYALKDYLDTVGPGTGWRDDFIFGDNDTREWPGAVFGPRADCGGAEGPGSAVDDKLTSSCSEGGGALVDKVIAEDGSVGYADLATARGRGLAITPGTNDNDTYWTQLPDGSAGNGVFREPTVDPKGFRTDVTQKGANCAGAEFTNKGAALPSTLGSWANVSGVNSPGAFATCTLTYGMVFDDNADVWGSSGEEEEKARTVKDYWETIVKANSQVGLLGRDYSPLPAQILSIAQAGVASIGWEKGPGGGGDGGGGDDGGGGGGDGGASVAPVPTPLTPSNLFSLPRKTISSKTGGATVSVKIPGPGVVQLVGTANVPAGKGKRNSKKTIQVGRTTLTAGGAGTYNLALKPSNAAKQQLRKTGKLKVNLKVTYTPTGGAASTSNSSLTLKLAVKKASGKNR